jgi:multisubunit Na+/H+ antiporter MnhB subunit
MSLYPVLGAAIDLILGLAASVLAFWIVLARDRLRATIGFLVYGLLMAFLWVRLGAVDVALTEAAIGGGLIGMLLLSASSRVPADPPPVRSWRLHLVAASVSAAVVVGLALVVLELPVPAPSLAPSVAANLSATQVENPITAVLMGFRAVDTLFEVVVLVLALIAFWSLIPSDAWSRRPCWLTQPVSRPALVLLARILIPLGVLVALHLLWIGTSMPGGKFQAGALLAALWALAIVAGSAQPIAASGRRMRALVVLGPAVFFAVGLAGLPLAGDFLAYPPGIEKPLILLIEIVLMVSVAAALGLILAGLPPPEREEPSPVREEEEEDASRALGTRATGARDRLGDGNGAGVST